MTIDISGLINTPPEEFDAKLRAFQARHPQFFKETDMADPIDDLVDHLEAMLVDPDRDTLTIRADPESGGLHFAWRSTDGEHTVMSLKRIEANPRLMLVNAIEAMRRSVDGARAGAVTGR